MALPLIIDFWLAEEGVKIFTKGENSSLVKLMELVQRHAISIRIRVHIVQ